MGHRMFVAIRPPDAVLDSLAALIEPRKDAGEGVRWIRPDQAHLSLAFMDDVAEADVDKLAAALRTVGRRTDGFTLSLDGAGAFPEVSKARELYQAVSTGGSDLGALAARVRTGIQRSAVKHDPRRFTAHLTLARIRKPQDATKWWRIIDTFGPFTFPVTEFGLYTSQLHSSGAEHTLFESFRLNEPLPVVL